MQPEKSQERDLQSTFTAIYSLEYIIYTKKVNCSGLDLDTPEN